MTTTVAFKTLKVCDFEYAYLDSGAPKSDAYTTWVYVHGMGFNAGVFKKLLPVSAAHNIRIISLYRRGYSPSSTFSEDELTGLGPGKKIEDAEPFFRGQAVELAEFLVTFAKEQGIPPADSNSPTGGIALIGWSLGGIHTHALLAYLDALSEETRTALGMYLHTMVSHDASAVALGIANPERHNIELWFKSDTKERLDAFYEWATAHYEHKSVTSGEIDDLEFNDPSDKPRSMHELSPEQLAEFTGLDPFANNGCDGLLLFCDVTAFRALTKRAIFDKSLARYLPNLRVRYMSSATSGGVLVWAMWMLKKHMANPKELYGNDAEIFRDIKFIQQDEGNHFIFWETPDKAIQQYTAAINLQLDV